MDNPAVYHCGDVMFDNSLHFAEIAGERSNILSDHNLHKNKFILGTIHRDHNTDDPKRLSAIFQALVSIAEKYETDVFLPLHPRTAKLLNKNIQPELLEKINTNPHLKIAKPVSFIEMIDLEQNASLVITDSGGVQKEAYFFRKPCIILRPQTEWVEIVQNGAAIIVDADTEKIKDSYHKFSNMNNIDFPPVFGDGKAAAFICKKIIETFNQ